MNKQLCVIFANCQGPPLRSILEMSPAFSRRFEVRTYINFLRQHIPEEDLRACSLFLYQPLAEKWGELASVQLLSRLNESCISVSIPNFHWAVFWPFNVHDPRNNPDDKLYPYGKYPYGNLIILNMLKAGLNSEQIFAQYMELDLNSVFNLSEVLTNTLTRAYADDCRLDVKVTPFIQQNFRSRRLFATINHPSFEVILEVANQVLPLVGIERLPADAVNGLPQWGGHILPIHPSITKFFKLEYESACANCLRYDKGYSQSDYIRGYIDFL